MSEAIKYKIDSRNNRLVLAREVIMLRKTVKYLNRKLKQLRNLQQV